MDTLDAGDFESVEEDANAYLLAQNKLWIVTGDSANFNDQIAALTRQAQSVQAQLGNPAQITAPQTGYFVRASGSGRLNAGAEDILAQSVPEMKAYLDADPVLPLDGCAGKIVAGFTWRCARRRRAKSFWAPMASLCAARWRSAFPVRQKMPSKPRSRR